MKRKIKKIILITLGILFVLMAIVGFVGVRYFNNFLFKETPNYFTFTGDFKPFDFEWSAGSYDHYDEPHEAILIPIKIESLAQKFYFQFDTGAPSTVLYENSLKSLHDAGLELNVIVKDEKRYVENFSFILGESHLNASMIEIYEDYGKPFDSNDTLQSIRLGTIGADFLVEKITHIDFKNQIIQFYKERPDWMSTQAKFKPFDFKARRFILPANINGKELELFYDSGSSAFGLITSKNRYDNFSDENVDEVSYEANSWGDAIPIFHKATNKLMTIGGTDLELKRVSYVDMYTKVQGLMSPLSRVGGLLGNKPFVDGSLIFDTKKEEFAVIK